MIVVGPTLFDSPRGIPTDTSPVLPASDNILRGIAGKDTLQLFQGLFSLLQTMSHTLINLGKLKFLTRFFTDRVYCR